MNTSLLLPSHSPDGGKFAHGRDKKIYFRVRGKNDPTVVVLNAPGSAQAEWWPFQNEIARQFRMITFDRAGYGGSTQPEKEKSLNSFSEGLEMLLKFERIKRPVLLISDGGAAYFAQHFALTRPGLVAGVLFINPPPPDLTAWKKAEAENEEFLTSAAMAEKRLHLASKGFYRLFSPLPGYKLDIRFRKAIALYYCKEKNYLTALEEFRLQESFSKGASLEKPLPAVPVRILFSPMEKRIREWNRQGIPEYTARQMARLYEELAKRYQFIYSADALLEVSGSMLKMHLSQPHRLLDEIAHMVKSIHMQ